jgi:hypothetical protein
MHTITIRHLDYIVDDFYDLSIEVGEVTVLGRWPDGFTREQALSHSLDFALMQGGTDVRERLASVVGRDTLAVLSNAWACADEDEDERVVTRYLVCSVCNIVEA